MDHKANFNILKRIEIIQSVFSDHNEINLKIKNKKTIKFVNMYDIV
jgi:hypothetical protein